MPINTNTSKSLTGRRANTCNQDGPYWQLSHRLCWVRRGLIKHDAECGQQMNKRMRNAFERPIRIKRGDSFDAAMHTNSPTLSSALYFSSGFFLKYVKPGYKWLFKSTLTHFSRLASARHVWSNLAVMYRPGWRTLQTQSCQSNVGQLEVSLDQRQKEETETEREIQRDNVQRDKPGTSDLLCGLTEPEREEEREEQRWRASVPSNAILLESGACQHPFETG